MFGVNNKNTSAFIVNFEHISHLVLVFLLLTFEHVIAGCAQDILTWINLFLANVSILYPLKTP